MAINKSMMWLILIMVGVIMSMVVLVSAADSPLPPDGVICYSVYLHLGMCEDYMTNGGVAPSGGCCNGTRAIYVYQATYPVERQTVCSCLKAVANYTALTPPMVTNFAALPGKCGIRFPYQISPNMDCSRVR